jgi:hypothetical protein
VLEFFSLPLRLADARLHVVHVALSRRFIERKLKIDGSMRQTASDPSTSKSLFLMY